MTRAEAASLLREVVEAVPAEPVARTSLAPSLFAAGFLAGLARSRIIALRRLGGINRSHTTSARPAVSLKARRENGVAV